MKKCLYQGLFFNIRAYTILEITKGRVKMKDTRKLSVIYFVVSLVMLLLVCFGCSNETEQIRTCRTYQNMDSVVCYDSSWESYQEMIHEGEQFVEGGLENFVLQSDFGIVEFEDGQLIYTSEK